MIKSTEQLRTVASPKLNLNNNKSHAAPAPDSFKGSYKPYKTRHFVELDMLKNGFQIKFSQKSSENDPVYCLGISVT